MRRTSSCYLALAVVIAGSTAVSTAAADKAAWKAFVDGRFSWHTSAPLVRPSNRAADPAISIKDPTIVHDQDRWHMFATVRLASGKVDIEYLNFADWKEADQAPRHRLNLHDQYYCTRRFSSSGHRSCGICSTRSPTGTTSRPSVRHTPPPRPSAIRSPGPSHTGYFQRDRRSGNGSTSG